MADVVLYSSQSTFLMNMLTKKRICNHGLSREATVLMESPGIVRQRWILGRDDSAYLEESHGHVILLEHISMHGGPLQHQADDSSLIVEGVIHFLLLCTLWRLCVVSASESRKTFSHFTLTSLSYLQRQRVTGPHFRKPAFWTHGVPSSALKKSPTPVRFWTKWIPTLADVCGLWHDSCPRNKTCTAASGLVCWQGFLLRLAPASIILPACPPPGPSPLG